MPISQPTGAATAATNESTSKARLHVNRPAKPGIKLIAATGTKALPVQTPDSLVSTNHTSPDLGRSEEKPKELKARVRENKESKAPQGTKKSKARTRENKQSKTPPSEATIDSPDAHPDPIYNPKPVYQDLLLSFTDFTHVELDSYCEAMRMALGGFSYALLSESPLLSEIRMYEYNEHNQSLFSGA